MTQHTPGPWQVQEGFLNVFTCTEGNVGLTIHLAKVNAEQVTGGHSEALANARLIAAAPDLLEALKMWKHASDHSQRYSTLDPEGCSDAWESAESLRDAAIAKAEGRT